MTLRWYISVFLKLSDLTFENLKASLSSFKVKEIQTRAQFCVNISMYFIDKIIQWKHYWPMPKSQPFILDRMRICGHILCERSFRAMLICWKKAGWMLTWIIKYCRRFLEKIDFSSSNGPNKSLKMGKFSLTQASVKWKFVTDVPDIFGLFLSPSRSCFHARW